MKSGLSDGSLCTFYFGFFLEQPDAESQSYEYEIKGLPVSAGIISPKSGFPGCNNRNTG
jgi:hypothetical protein